MLHIRTTCSRAYRTPAMQPFVPCRYAPNIKDAMRVWPSLQRDNQGLTWGRKGWGRAGEPGQTSWLIRGTASALQEQRCSVDHTPGKGRNRGLLQTKIFFSTRSSLPIPGLKTLAAGTKAKSGPQRCFPVCFEGWGPLTDLFTGLSPMSQSLRRASQETPPQDHVCRGGNVCCLMEIDPGRGGRCRKWERKGGTRIDGGVAIISGRLCLWADPGDCLRMPRRGVPRAPW